MIKVDVVIFNDSNEIIKNVIITYEDDKKASDNVKRIMDRQDLLVKNFEIIDENTSNPKKYKIGVRKLDLLLTDGTELYKEEK